MNSNRWRRSPAQVYRAKKSGGGFTLVELLVVIAIITILASIVVPNVVQFLGRGQEGKAVSEVRSIETSMTAMLTDVGLTDFKQFFVPNAAVWNTVNSVAEAQEVYTNVFYDLLINGKNPQEPQTRNLIRPNVLNKLGTSYMDLGRDPWGNLYQFHPGPWRNPNPYTQIDPDWAIIPFRIYRVDDTNAVPGRGATEDVFTKPNVPADDGNTFITVGYPPNRERPVFIYSMGQDLVSGQAVFNSADNYDPSLEDIFKGGGDDINNWDSDQTWAEFY